METYELYRDVTAGKPIAITELKGRGKGIVATRTIDADTEIWREEPLVCIQHLYSRESVRVCEQCLRFVAMETDAKVASSVPATVACGRICTAVFCSSQCQRKANATWHALLCANRYLSDKGGNSSGSSVVDGNSSGSNADKPDLLNDNPIVYFYQFAQGTNDLLLLVARLVATIIATEEREEASGQALLEKLSYVHSAPWWEVATRDPCMAEDERTELKVILRTLTNECLLFLRAIFGDRPLVDDLLTEEFVGNMVGAFELNNADVIVEPPADLLEILQLAAQSAVQSDSEREDSASVGEESEDDTCDDENDFICRGNALYGLQSCMNHSCQPNTLLTREGDSTIIVKAATRIAEGEELTISYIDESLTHSERQAALVDYGFECGCPRCLLHI